MKRKALTIACCALLGAILLLGADVRPALAGDGEAAAEDPVDAFEARVEAYEDTVDEHHRDKAVEALLSDVRNGTALFDESLKSEVSEKLEKYREKIVKAIGDLVRSREDSVSLAAIQALGDMRHEDGARYLKSFLKPVDDGGVDAHTDAAMTAAGEIADDSLVVSLLNVFEKSDNLSAAGKALRTLGKFRGSKRYRERILEDVVKSVAKSKPGGVTRGKPNQVKPEAPIGNRTGNAAGDRWGALGGILPEAMNELTGQRFATAEDWIDVVNQHKRNLRDVFVAE